MLDDAVLAWFIAHRHEGVTRAMLLVSEAHRTIPVLVVVALLAGLLAWQGRARRWLPLLVLGVPGAMLANVAVKHLVQRARPAGDEALLVLHTYSFPSGHAAAVGALYTFMAVFFLAHLPRERRRARGLVVAACALMITWVATSRLYLGVHYLTDVVAGAALGIAWVLGCAAALRRWRPAAPGEGWHTPAP